MEYRSVGLLHQSRMAPHWREVGDFVVRSYLLFTLAKKNLPDPAKPNLSWPFRFAFESEERANNNQKQNTVTCHGEAEASSSFRPAATRTLAHRQPSHPFLSVDHTNVPTG